MKKIIFFLLIGFFSISLYGQTGPGGVATTTGTGNLKLWLKGDSVSIDGGSGLMTLKDLSGYGFDFTQSDANYQPVVSAINGFGALDFQNVSDGFGDYLTNSDLKSQLNGQSAFTILFVIKSDVTNTDNGFFTTITPTGSDAPFSIRYDAEGTNGLASDVITASTGVPGIIESSASSQTTNNQLVKFKWITNSTPQLFLDGASNTLSHGNPYTGSITGADITYLGKGTQDDNADEGWDGLIAEVIFFNKQLNSAEQNIVENYLASRYALTISNDLFSNPIDFKYDAVGIGMETDGKHSGSVSAGFGLYEDNSTLGNGEYVFASHKNTTNDVGSIQSGANVTTSSDATHAWARDWYLEKTGDIDLRVYFDFSDGFENGGVPQNISNYRLLYKSTEGGNYTTVTTTSQGIQAGDQVYFEVENANIADGYYTLGTVDQTNSPLQGSNTQTWYTLVGGDWTDPSIWSLDPSGALPLNPENEYPDEFDIVYILSGRTVTITTPGIETKQLNVTGRLELGTTAGHNFTEIRGEGRIVLEGDNFPGGDATHFVSDGQGEGTVIYTGLSRSLTTPHTFFNMEVELDNDADVIALFADYTLNGYLNIKKGKLQMNDNLGVTSIDLLIKGDATISTGTEFIVGTGNAIHNIEFQGNVTNNGIIDFSNAAQYDCPANGAVRTDFTGAADNTLICNGRTDLYRLIVNKGTDETYTLSVLSTDVANFALYGPIGGGDCIDPADGPEGWERLAMVIQKGTLKLGSNINIPRLAENRTGTVSNEFLIPAGSRLWIDGANVSTHEAAGGWRGLTLYGTLQVSAGSFTNPTGTGGITYYGNLASPGKIILTGGAIYTTQLKQDNPDGRISYIQSGGALYINNLSDSRGSSAVFGLANAEHTFEMSGGLIQISAINTTATNGIHILCAEGNYNVTGGTFELLLPTLDAVTETQFEINSTVPFYNLTLTNSGFAGPQPLALQAELVVLDSLTIGANTTLNTAGYTVSVGGNFELEDGGTYTHGNNTTKFIGSKNSAIIVGNTNGTAPLQFYDFEIEKDLQSNPALFWDVEVQSPGRTAGTVPLSINNNFTIKRGSFNTGEFDVQMNGIAMEIVDGTITNSTNGMITLTDIGSQHTLKSAYGATNQSFGHINMNNATQGAKLLSDIKATDITLSAAATLFDLDIYNLEVTNSINGWSNTKYFRTAGNGSDGGLTLHFTISGSSTAEVLFATFPVGTTAGYSPAEIYLDDYNIATPINGSIQVTPVNSRHPGADPVKSIVYYWVSNEDGFSGVPDNQAIYKFYLPGSITKSGDDRDVALIGSIWVASDYTNNKDLLQFRYDDYGFIDGEFSSGNTGQFKQRRTLYSKGAAGATLNWHSKTNWSLDPHGGVQDPLGGGDNLPEETDICVIGEGHRMNATTAGFTIGRLEFSHDTTGASGFEDIPRVQIDGNFNFNFGKVVGTGMFTQWWGTANNPTVTGDFGAFANERYSWFLFVAENDNLTLPTNSVFPNLAVESDAANWRRVSFTQNIVVNYDLLVQGNAILLLNNGATGNVSVTGNTYIGNWGHGEIRFPTSGNKRTFTTMGDIDFTLNVTAPTNARQITVLNTTPSTLRHDLNLGGSIIQDAGVIDLYNGTGATANHAVLKLIGQNNGTFTRSGAGATDLYRIEMFKTPGKSFTFNNTFALNGPTNAYPKALELLSGDFIIDAAGQDLTLSSGGALFRIPSTSSLTVGGISGNPAIVRVSGNNTGIYLDGKLTLNDFSQALFNSGTNNYIEYSASGFAQIDVNNAEFRVGSQIRRPTTTDQGVLKFNQLDANSTVVLGEVDAPTSNRGVLEILNDGSTFTQVENANITIVRGQTSASVAALLLNPTNMTIETGSSITFGNASLTSASEIGINSTKNLQNIIVNSTNATAKMMVRALNIDESLTITNGVFDANGLALNIKGNFSNSSTFMANGNTTTFNGLAAQSITGVTTFYNLTKSTSNTLSLNNAITVENDLAIQSGTLSDNGNTLNLEGDLTMDGTHSYGSAGFGINMSGTEEQRISGTGSIGYLTIANPYLVRVLTGANVTITNGLNMNGGIFDVGQNLVVLTKDADVIEGSPYSNANMIRTNASFTDNGVRKYFKSTAEAGGPYTLTLPIGSGTKYTPIIFNLTANGNSNGYITSKAADEYHPSIVEDEEYTEIVDSLNVLWYHWVLKSSGVSGFAGTVYMKYDPSDIYVTSPYSVNDYIAARILNDGSGLWNKYDPDDFDEANNRMIFTFNNVGSDEIFGDYTAGIDSAIPDQVPFYETIANGNWNDGSIWDPYVAGGPRGAMVRINSGHTATIPNNGVSSYTTTINGRLEVNLTYAHRLGNVDGTGTLYMQRPSLPAGDYDGFFSSFGGTLEYGGSNDYDVMASYPAVNNLKFSGTGKRRLPTQNILMYGDFIIDGTDAFLQVVNDHNKKITVMGDVTFNSGSFEAGNTVDAKFVMDGDVPQTISGSFTGSSRDFNHFVMDNPTGVTFNNSVDIYGNLNFNSGIITVADNEVLSLTYFTNTITGAGPLAYVDGVLRKNLGQAAAFTFPVGDGDRYAPTVITNTQPSGTFDWEVEYFDSNPIDHPVPLPPANKEATLELVSEYEYWRVNGPASGASPLQIRWDAYSLLPAMTADRVANLRMVEWSTTNTQWEIVTPYTISDGGVNSGTITSDNSLSLNNDHFFTIGTTEGTPLPAAGFITQDTTICSGSNFNLRIMLTGTQPWSIKVHDSVSGKETEYTNITASPFEIPISPGADITYTITEIADNTTGYITTTIYGDPVNVTVAPLATVPTTFSDERCGVGIVNLSASGALATENYRWYVSDVEPYPFLSDVDELDVFLNNTTTYYVSTYNTGGCESSRVPVTGTIHPIPAFTPSATPATICFDESSELNAEYTETGATTYLWSPAGAELVTENIANPIYTPVTNPTSPVQVTVTYSVKVTDENSCFDTETVNIVVNRRPETGPQYHISNDWGN